MHAENQGQEVERVDLANFQAFKNFFKLINSFSFRKRGREGEREGEKHQCVVASHMPHTGDLAHNPGMCPDWELNQQPFALWADAQSTEPHKPGQFSSFDPVTLSPRYTSALYKN